MVGGEMNRTHLHTLLWNSACGGRQAFPSALAWALVLWLLLIASSGAVLAVQTAGFPVFGAPQHALPTVPMAAVAGVSILTCLVPAVLVRWLRPASTLPVTFISAGLVLVWAAVRSDAVGAVIVVLALMFLCWLAGDAVLCELPTTAAAPIVRLPIGIGLGFGLVGLGLLFLTTLGWLNAATVAAGAATIILLTVLRNRGKLSP